MTRHIDGYTIGAEIGRGTQAIVYEGYDQQLRPRAFKEYAVNQGGEDEYSMLMQVQRANIQQSHVIYADLRPIINDNLFIIPLERLGPSISTLFQIGMNPFILINIAFDTAKALLELFQARVCQCDPNPENFLLGTRLERTVLTDLGLAVPFGHKMKGQPELIGAPELASGITTPTTDTYMWARMLEFLLTNRWDLGPHSLITDVPELRWIGQGFAEIIRECTQHSPIDRPMPPQLVASLYQALSNVRQEHSGLQFCDAKEPFPYLSQVYEEVSR